MTRAMLLLALSLAAAPASAEPCEPCSELNNWCRTMTPGCSIQLSTGQIAAIQSGVRDILRDPDSAKFGSMAAAPHEAGLFICGWVNAKNAYGGYTGMMPFMGILWKGDPPTFDAVPTSGRSSERIQIETAREMCAKRGIISF